MDSLASMRIGILGGTFDPIHYGHLLIAQSAVEEFGLSQMVFLPTGKSPHKAASQVSDPFLRCEMVKAAIGDNPKFAFSDLEAENTEVNYTYRTLEKFHQRYPNARFYFVMGEDSLDDLPSWKNPREICRLSSILVAVRGDTGNGITEKIKAFSEEYGADMHLLHSPNFSISSREIRKRIQMGRSVQYMIPKEVLALILQHSLYME